MDTIQGFCNAQPQFDWGGNVLKSPETSTNKTKTKTDQQTKKAFFPNISFEELLFQIYLCGNIVQTLF